MKLNYTIEADTHCHTVASTHGYGTVLENAMAASEKGLSAIALTDHGPALPDSPHPWHFYNLKVLPKKINGVIIIRGIEANIMDTKEVLDLEEHYIKELDWVIASLHKQTFPVGSLQSHTDAMINACKNKYVDVIGHPAAPDYPIDVRAVVKACKENNKFIEINDSSFRVRRGGEKLRKEIALECMRLNAKVVVNSDAHCPWDIGNISTASDFLASINFPQELIFNSKVEKIIEHISKKHGRNVLSA